MARKSPSKSLKSVILEVHCFFLFFGEDLPETNGWLLFGGLEMLELGLWRFSVRCVCCLWGF